jgi:predicted lipoprotein with Yx(FWY)xxD motif
MRRVLLVLAAAGATAAVLAATALPASSGPATLTTRTTKLGRVLVNANGRTLYLFEKDKNRKSSCSGACAQAWPPLITSGAPKAGSGAQTSKLGSTKRADGRMQVTYAGHPLYTFAADKKAGDTKGEELDAFGAEWYALSAGGHKVEKHEEQTPPTTTTSPSPSPY